jgi:hypothetical protein
LETALTSAGFGLSQKLSLHGLGEGADLRLVDRMPEAGGSPIILQLHGVASTEALAVTALNEATPGADWGLGAQAPAVIGPSSELDIGYSLSADRLVELGTGNARLLWPGSALDGQVGTFGKRFWTWLGREAPLEVGAVQNVGAAQLHYSDRYLLQAHTIRLLVEVIRSTPGKMRPEVAIDLANDDRPRTDARFIHQNFPAGDIREKVIRTLLPGSQVRLNSKSDMAHYRVLSIELADGRRLEILLDQGFGSWRTGEAIRHDFYADVARQARAVEGAVFTVKAENPSPPVAVRLM